jgi:hypothetical protein
VRLLPDRQDPVNQGTGRWWVCQQRLKVALFAMGFGSLPGSSLFLRPADLKTQTGQLKRPGLNRVA